MPIASATVYGIKKSQTVIKRYVGKREKVMNGNKDVKTTSKPPKY